MSYVWANRKVVNIAECDHFADYAELQRVPEDFDDALILVGLAGLVVGTLAAILRRCFQWN